MRVLVTGHNGYIGSVMVDVLARAGHDVVGVDTYLYEDCTFGEERIAVPALRTDVRDLEVSALSGFDAVIHLAALSDHPHGKVDPQITADVNHHASVRLARLAREAGVKRFLFASSCSLYSGSAHGALLTEEAEFNPATRSAESKLLVEQSVSLLATGRFTPVFLRTAMAYGASPRLRTDLVVNSLVASAFTTGEMLIYSDGSQWRPFVHVEDISRAFAAVLQAPQHLVHNRAFNVGRTSENYRIRDVAEIVREVLGGTRVTYAPGAGPEPTCYRVDFDELAWSIPAFKPRWTVREGVRELYEAFSRDGLTCDRIAGPGSRYVRLQHLHRLRSRGLLDDQIRWTSFPGHLGAPSSASPHLRTS